MATRTRTTAGARRTTPRSSAGTAARRGTGSGQRRGDTGGRRSTGGGQRAGTGSGQGRDRGTTRSGKRRNPNRWRFYVLLALLAVIVAAVLWFTVGQQAFADFMADRERDGAERADTEQAETGAVGDDGAGSAGDDAAGDDGAGSAGSDDPAGAGAPGAAEDPVEKEPAEPDEHDLANPVTCRGDALDVQVDLDGRTHPAGSSLPIQVTVTNAGPVPCLIDLGHGAVLTEITSGGDDIWSTAECPTGSATRELLLDLDAQAQHTVSWSGQRCGSGNDAEAGTYRVSVEVSGTDGVAEDEQVLELD